MKNEGIDTEAGYPNPCNKSCCFLKDKVGATVTGESFAVMQSGWRGGGGGGGHPVKLSLVSAPSK